MAPIFTILGATGTQGGSVVDAALKSGLYKVRAVTRSVDGDKAKALAARGVEVVAADLNSEESLIKAFEGSTAIFGVTNFFEPFFTKSAEEAVKIEKAQGINIANAAAKTSTLKHYIWSTLPDAAKITNGKHSVPHFEAKADIDKYIKTKKDLYAKTTFFWVTYYASNILFPMFTPNLLKTSGKYVQLGPVPATVPVLSVGDVGTNVGVFTSAILAQPKLTHGKYVTAYSEKTTMGGLLQDWSEVTGKPALYVETSQEDYNNVFPKWGDEMAVMLKFWNEVGAEKAWSGEDLVTSEQLGLKKEDFVNVKESYAKLDFSSL